jgi:hypothetical protein
LGLSPTSLELALQDDHPSTTYSSVAAAPPSKSKPRPHLGAYKDRYAYIGMLRQCKAAPSDLWRAAVESGYGMAFPGARVPHTLPLSSSAYEIMAVVDALCHAVGVEGFSRTPCSRVP